MTVQYSSAGLLKENSEFVYAKQSLIKEPRHGSHHYMKEVDQGLHHETLSARLVCHKSSDEWAVALPVSILCDRDAQKLAQIVEHAH